MPNPRKCFKQRCCLLSSNKNWSSRFTRWNAKGNFPGTAIRSKRAPPFSADNWSRPASNSVIFGFPPGSRPRRIHTCQVSSPGGNTTRIRRLGIVESRSTKLLLQVQQKICTCAQGKCSLNGDELERWLPCSLPHFRFACGE